MSTKPVAYMEKAISKFRNLGIPLESPPAPVLKIVEQVQHYDGNRILSIANVLQKASVFNAAIREQIGGMQVADRYADITTMFNSIREDAQDMAKWMEDGKLDFVERLQYGWMKVRRGSIPDRFNSIRDTYLDVASSANDQITRESTILEGYQDFRMALKSAEIDAQEVLKIATVSLADAKTKLSEANQTLESYQGGDETEKTRLELARDEAIRALQNEDKAYQIVKDLADDLKTSYNTSELVFARIKQTSAVKERLYQRSVSFFSTNELVFTGLAAAFTQSAGLSEATNTMEAMKKGMNDGLEAMGSANNSTLDKALKSGYGATISAASVQNLANAIVDFQASSIKLIEELRKESTQSAEDIEKATDDSKRRFTELVAKGA